MLYRKFPKSSQTGFVSYSSIVEGFHTSNISQEQAQRLPIVSSELWYCICLVLGNKAFTVLVFCALDFNTKDYDYPCAYLQLLGYFAISERKCFTRHFAGIKRSSGRKRYYPPQSKHPPRVAAARVLRDYTP